jgi:hypothetical protein
VTVAVTAVAYDHVMSATTRPALRLIPGGRTDDDGRQSVDLCRHDTEEVRSVAWALPRLLATIRRYRPRRPGDPDSSTPGVTTTGVQLEFPVAGRHPRIGADLRR